MHHENSHMWTAPRLIALSAAASSEGGILAGLTEGQKFPTVSDGTIRGVDS